LNDFHAHTNFSDGFLPPHELLDYAKSQGVTNFAITDHDTINALPQAQKYAKEIDLNLITGVEISTTWRQHDIHIIGLNIDINNPILTQGLKQHQDFREQRAIKMARGLENAGIRNAYDKTIALVKNNMITRTHFAQMMVKEGICKDIKTVFKRYLVGNLPGNVKGEWAGLADAVHWINSAGGVAIIAHPTRYKMTQNKLKTLSKEFKDIGGKGLEVITATTRPHEVEKISNLVLELDLYASMGSDYHGWDNSFIKIGHLKNLPSNLKSIWETIQ
jgi:predicted metal-dependent phosphoesterase TrpH